MPPYPVFYTLRVHWLCIHVVLQRRCASPFGVCCGCCDYRSLCWSSTRELRCSIRASPSPSPLRPPGGGVCYGVAGGCLQSIGATYPALCVASWLRPTHRARDFHPSCSGGEYGFLWRAVPTALSGAPSCLSHASVTLVRAGVHVCGVHISCLPCHTLADTPPSYHIVFNTSLSFQLCSNT